MCDLIRLWLDFFLFWAHEFFLTQKCLFLCSEDTGMFYTRSLSEKKFLSNYSFAGTSCDQVIQELQNENAVTNQHRL